MKVTVESKKGLKTNLRVVIDKKAIQEKVNERLIELSKTANMKGFRPGKVPINVLKSQFGKPVYGEILEKVLKESSSKAIEDKKIKVAGQPKLDLKSYGEEKDLNYTIEIDELPLIKLKPLDSIKFIEYEIKVSDDDLKKRIKDIAKNQENYKDKKKKDTAKNGDLVIFDYNATIENKSFEGGEGKNTQIVLGKDLFIKGFDIQLIGIKKNETRTVESLLPENYPKKEFANKKAKFSCKILNVKEPIPTTINDEFAKNLGAKDLNDLKLLVTKQIQNQYKTNLDSISKENILNQIEKLHEVDIPNNLLEQEISLITQGLNKDDIEKHKKENTKIAKKRIKLGLLLNELGENNNLKVTEEELRNEMQKQIQSMPDQQKQILEYYKKNPGASSNLRGSIYEEKILTLIKNKSKKINKIISLKDADTMLKADQDKRHNHDHKHAHSSNDDIPSKKPKKTDKTITVKKKIRKK